MILKTHFLLALSIAWEVSGASFSKVFVQTGPEAAPPVEYVKLGAPSYTYEYATPQIEQIKATPVAFEYPIPQNFGYETPCTSNACFYPGQTIATVASVAPSANILAYSAPIPNLPVVYSPRQNEPTGYKYSYTIVNQNKEDYKVQNKLSEGGLIREEYALLQPDGVLREIQYVTNDGFNAIIKNVSPGEEVKLTEKIIQPAVPCPEVKSGALTDLESYGNDKVNKKTNFSANPEAKKNNLEVKEEQQELVIQISLEPSNEDYVEPNENLSKRNKEEIQKQANENQQNRDGPRTHEEIIDQATIQDSNENQAATTEQSVVESNVYVSYNDIIKCIQAAMTKVNTHPSIPKPMSPLTYLVFNQPC